jgi:hypothetical protein
MTKTGARRSQVSYQHTTFEAQTALDIYGPSLVEITLHPDLI